jgi:hypothetical protein
MLWNAEASWVLLIDFERSKRVIRAHLANVLVRLLREVLAVTFVFYVAGFYVEGMLNICDQDFFHTFDNIVEGKGT